MERAFQVHWMTNPLFDHFGLRCFTLYLHYCKANNLLDGPERLEAWACSINFCIVIYGQIAVNYEIFTIYMQIYSQNLALITNP